MTIYKSVMLMLHINLHVESGGDHYAIIVERFNSFLNKGLHIFCNEHDITQPFIKGA